MELDVVPLFESREDLGAAPDIFDELAALPGAGRWFDSRDRSPEIMLGYSDSAKDVGMFAANSLSTVSSNGSPAGPGTTAST